MQLEIDPKMGYKLIMAYEIKLTKKVLKNLRKSPQFVQEKFSFLIEELVKGPIQKDWPNYSKLDHNKHHCHLAYSWVACWKHEKNEIIIEVYYVGSREKAPY